MAHDQISIVILNPNEIEREGLRRIVVENGFAVAGVHRSTAELNLDLRADSPDIVSVLLLDQATESGSLRSVSDLRARWPDCKIIVMSSGCDSRTVIGAFQAGVDGYVGKHISCASLTEMIKLVALGEKIVPYEIVRDLPSHAPRSELQENRLDASGAKLSDRQIDILRGLARGEPNKVISRRLSITEATVKVHVKSILRRIGVANRTQAAVWAIEAGLLLNGADAAATADPPLRNGAAKSFEGNGACLT